MAAPSETCVQNIGGRWKINSSLSQDINPVMQLQEVPWLVRTLVAKAAVSVLLKQNVHGRTIRIDSTQTSLGHGLEETWLLDWEPRESSHTVFGKLVVRARLASPGSVGEVMLRGRSELYEDDWQGDVIELHVEGEGWTSTQVWGFTTIEGERRYARRSVVRKGDDSKIVQVVYDWVGPNDL